jgi:hypothetical protein
VKLSHTLRVTSAVFDDPNLVSSAGLVPMLALAESAGLHELAAEHLSVPTDKGANAGLKVASLVGVLPAVPHLLDSGAAARSRARFARTFARFPQLRPDGSSRIMRHQVLVLLRLPSKNTYWQSGQARSRCHRP